MKTVLLNVFVLSILAVGSYLDSGWDDTTRIWVSALFVILSLGTLIRERTEKPETTRDEE